MTDSQTSTDRVAWGMMTPYCRTQRSRQVVSFHCFKTFGKGPTGRFILLPLMLLQLHSLHDHCCLHSSRFTFAGRPPRPLPPARAAPRRGGGRSSSSESCTLFMSAKQEKKKCRETTYHINIIDVVIIIIFILVIVLIFREHIVFKRLASEIVDSTRYDL